MKMPKKFMIFYFFFILLLALTLRAGHTDPRGGDTWATSIKAETINENGAVLWVLHPLSFFGWYPYSYPSGEMILLSGISQCTSLGMLATVEITSIFFGIFGIFSLFLLAREIMPIDFFCIITIFAYSTFSHVLGYTLNNASTRGLFIMFYPIVVFNFLGMIKYPTKRMTFLFCSIIAIIALSSIHRMILLFTGIIVLPLIIMRIGQFVWQSHKFTIPFLWSKVVPIIFFIVIFYCQLIGISFIKPDLRKYEIIMSGDSTISLFFNLAASYGIKYGLSAVLTPLGIIFLMLKQRKMFAETHLLLISFISIFFIVDLAYFRSFFPPIAAILVGMGVKFLFEKNVILITGFMIIIIIVVSTQYFWFYLQNDFLSGHTA